MNSTHKMSQRIAASFPLRRVFSSALFLMIFVLAVRQCVYIDPDLWWHLQTGQDIVLTRSIPRVDIYSCTKAGSEWITHEWLSEVLMYGIYRFAGWGGLVLIFSGLVVTAMVITYRHCEGRPYIAGLAVLLAAAASAPLFGIRPQMITFLLASIYIGLPSRFAREVDFHFYCCAERTSTIHTKPTISISLLLDWEVDLEWAN